MIDVGQDLITCEMCQSAQVRFVHIMEHSEYRGPLQVGCVCASKMEQTPSRAKAREKLARSKSTRRKTWLSRKWRIFRRGNPYLKCDGVRVVIQRSRRGHFSFSVDEERSPKWYDTEEEAKLAAFDVAWEKAHPLTEVGVATQEVSTAADEISSSPPPVPVPAIPVTDPR